MTGTRETKLRALYKFELWTIQTEAEMSLELISDLELHVAQAVMALDTTDSER